ncbi:MAG TPA: four-carbon acid sugar kinase family protein [Candidatus Eisenbacteria bacterium]|nr:four-carbon acid sugar kinase family protein [Candidatus Eisenbacteria bacterium]
MIVILADDLTGAAELAGVAAARGLSAEVQPVTFLPDTDARVIAVDTRTRGAPADEAAQRVADLARQVARAGAEWVFKKVDSVLRGPVLAEVRSAAAALGLPRALLVPANPSRGRSIQGGRYRVGGRPLHETAFAQDPEYPATTDDVVTLLGAGPDDEVWLLGPDAPAPARGIAVPDVRTTEELRARARAADATVLPAGAAEFFEAVLTARGLGGAVAAPEGSPAHVGPDADGAGLIVCGSAVAWEATRGEQSAARGIPVLTMPRGLFTPEAPEALLSAWAAEVVRALDRAGAALVALGDRDPLATIPAGRLTERVAEVVRRVLGRRTIGRLLVEGGATASAVVRALGWSRLRVCDPADPGVVGLRPTAAGRPDLYLKPGSYGWPDRLWPLPRYRAAGGDVPGLGADPPDPPSPAGMRGR